MQLQYGSIGWSVGATLGYAVGRPKTRMLSLIGDGSFQVTAQVLLRKSDVGVGSRHCPNQLDASLHDLSSLLGIL